MRKYPYIVHSYEEFNDFNPFLLSKLASAIQDPDNITKEICSQLTAVIWYHTPYRFTDDSPCIVSFALSNDIMVSTILGCPSIAAMHMNLLASTNSVVSSTISQTFYIEAEEPLLGLPTSKTFDPATLT